MTDPIADLRPLRWTPNTPIPPLFIATLDVSASGVIWYDPEGRTAASDADDEWSDENLRRWEEADRLDPDLAEWVNAQLGE